MPETFDSWAILELMGHVRMAGRVTEEERFGSKLGRIDVPDENGGFTTVYFGAGSVYRLTATTEEVARAVAVRNKPEPVHRWELPKPETAADVLDGRRQMRPEEDEYLTMMEVRSEPHDDEEDDEDDEPDY